MPEALVAPAWTIPGYLEARVSLELNLRKADKN